MPAHNRPLDPEERGRIKADYAAFRDVNRLTPTAIGGRRPSIERSALEVSEEERRAEYEARWADGGLTYLGAFTDLLIDPAANATAADFVREQIAAIVEDPEVAERLMPDTVVGCKRMCVDTGYYATFNRPDVHLVDLARDADRGDHPGRHPHVGRPIASSTRSSSPPASTR